MKKKGKPSPTRDQIRLNRAIKTCRPVMLPLLELFSVVDDVFEEEDAFSEEHIHQSLGRCYRAWLEARDSLDVDFNRDAYRQHMKKAAKKSVTLSSLGAKKFKPHDNRKRKQ